MKWRKSEYSGGGNCIEVVVWQKSERSLCEGNYVEVGMVLNNG